MPQSLWDLLIRYAKLKGSNAYDTLLDEINKIFSSDHIHDEDFDNFDWEEYLGKKNKTNKGQSEQKKKSSGQRKTSSKRKTKTDHSYDDWEYWEKIYNESRRNKTGAHSKGTVDPKIAQYYANLELEYGADIEEIKKAWKKLMKKYHPDLHHNDPEKYQVALELTKSITHAYQELLRRM